MCGPPMPAWLWRKVLSQKRAGEVGGRPYSVQQIGMYNCYKVTPFPENAYTVLQRQGPHEIPPLISEAWLITESQASLLPPHI